MKTSQGSTHVVIVIILVVALIGAVGYVAWQNLNKNADSQKNEQTAQVSDPKDETPERSQNKIYSGEELSFEYPGSGWQEGAPQDDVNNIVVLQTDDYKPSIGMGLDAGASLYVYRTTQQEVPMDMGTAIKDVEEIRVDGNKGFKYTIEYEGYRLQAFFTVGVGTNDERNYGITMQTAASPSDAERTAFELVLSTVNVK